MSNLDDERTDAEVSRRINAAPFMTYKEECEALREQVKKLTKERDIKEHCIVQLEAEDLRMKAQLAALAEQNDKMREALEAQPRQTKMDWRGVHTPTEITQLRDEALSLPDLASPVLNRIRADGMRMAKKVVLAHSDCIGDEMDQVAKEIDARAAELEKGEIV